jgi:8-oxo-dGTP diphosphatase
MEETGLSGVSLRQIRAFSAPGRDPRGTIVSVAFLGIVGEDADVKGGDDAAEAKWFLMDEIPFPLAFDHDEILKAALALHNNY